MLSSLWSSEDDSVQNLSRRPSSMGGYLLKLKRKCSDEVSSSVSTTNSTTLNQKRTGIDLVDSSATLLDPFGQWNRRWINIESHYLRWYSKVTTSQASGSVDLRYVTCIRELRESDLSGNITTNNSSNMNAAGTGINKHSDNAVSFLIESKERPLVLRCASPGEMEKWVRILNMLVDRAQGGDGTRGVSSNPKGVTADVSDNGPSRGGMFNSSAPVHVSTETPSLVQVCNNTQRPNSADLTSSSSRGSSRDSSSTGPERRRKRKEAAARKKDDKSIEGRIDNALTDLAGIESVTGKMSNSSASVHTTDSTIKTPEKMSSTSTVHSPDAARNGTIAGRMNPANATLPTVQDIESDSSILQDSARFSYGGTTGVFHVRGGSTFESKRQEQFNGHNPAFGGDVMDTTSTSGSMGLRIRRNIEENPVANDVNNGHSFLSAGNRPGSAGSTTSTGMAGLGGRRGIGYGTGAGADSSSHATKSTKSYVNKKDSHLKHSEKTQSKKGAVNGGAPLPPPMPDASMPDAYRIKKDDIMRKLGAVNVALSSKKAWGSPVSSQVYEGECSDHTSFAPKVDSPTNAALLQSMEDINDVVVANKSSSPEVDSIAGVIGTNGSISTNTSAVRTFSTPSAASDITYTETDDKNQIGKTNTRNDQTNSSLGSAITTTSNSSNDRPTSANSGGLSYRIAKSMGM